MLQVGDADDLRRLYAGFACTLHGLFDGDRIAGETARKARVNLPESMAKDRRYGA